MKEWLLAISIFSVICFQVKGSTGVKKIPSENPLFQQNLKRAIELCDRAFKVHFQTEGMKMARFFNPKTQLQSDETGSIWMYTSAIEAVNAILRALQLEKEFGLGVLYEKHFDRYQDRLSLLYDNIDYYLGTYRLTSYTQTKNWSVYGVHRSSVKGAAKVAGIENVYDDQMWLIREYLQSYKITGQSEFLERAEYLTAYVLDGWDCSIDEDGNEVGGIPWGPGYVTKHACSNGPMVSPLVWLSEIYRVKEDEVEYRYIDPKDRQTRRVEKMNKSDYYLMFAKKIYNWQKGSLLIEEGVYADMMGGCYPSKPETEKVNGQIYRKGINCTSVEGPPYSYNSGTMLSGAADLFRVTGNKIYKSDGKNLSDSSFAFFARKDQEIAGLHSYDTEGFRVWFNGVLLRGFVDMYQYYEAAENYINTFQENLDFGFEHHLYNGFLPVNLLGGWKKDSDQNDLEGMFSFSYVAVYANLAKYLTLMRDKVKK